MTTLTLIFGQTGQLLWEVLEALEATAVLEVTDWEVLEVTDWDMGSATEDLEVMVVMALEDMASGMAMAVSAIMGLGRGRQMRRIISEKRGINTFPKNSPE